MFKKKFHEEEVAEGTESFTLKCNKCESEAHFKEVETDHEHVSMWGISGTSKYTIYCWNCSNEADYALCNYKNQGG